MVLQVPLVYKMTTKKCKGHNFLDGYYSTQRGLADYSRVHQLDFIRLIEEAKLQEGTVVDLGCGNANFLADLKKLFPNMKVYGVDKVQYESRLSEDELIQADISRGVKCLDSEIADLVVSTTLVQWLPADSVDPFYVEVNRLMKKEGRGIVFPLASKEVSEERGRYFVNGLEFERPVNIRKIKLPETLDGKLASAYQVLFGDFSGFLDLHN